MNDNQIAFIDFAPKDNTEKNKKRRWENGFQKWSNEGMQGAKSYNDYYGVCGTSNICDYCTDNSKGRPCVRALNAMCRDKGISLDYNKSNYEEIWDL